MELETIKTDRVIDALTAGDSLLFQKIRQHSMEYIIADRIVESFITGEKYIEFHKVNCPRVHYICVEDMFTSRMAFTENEAKTIFNTTAPAFLLVGKFTPWSEVDTESKVS